LHEYSNSVLANKAAVITRKVLIMKIPHWKKLVAGSAIALGMSMVGGQEAQAATQTAVLNISASVVAVCSISNVAGLNFGVYDVTAAGADDTTGSFDVTCSSGAPVVVELDEGANAAVGSLPDAPLRTMVDGAVPTPLAYSLYTDAARTTAWGAGAAAVGTTGTGVAQAFTVYGRIPALQAALSGAYTDTVTVTVTY
jgi:spore coat protein U-like protein